MQLDLHMHTRYSFDCNMDPEKLIKVAKRRGLDGIAITDHNVIEGAIETARIAPKDLIVIVGEEIATTAGDIIGLFLHEQIVTDDPIIAIDAIKAQGGVAILPHPFTSHLSVDEKVARKLDGCEGFNARHARSKTLDNTIGEPHVVEFAKLYDLTLTASSDAHFYREIGRARTILPASNLQEIKDALLRGNTVLHGERSSSLNRLASVLLKFGRKMLNPTPEGYDRRRQAEKAKPASK